MPVAEKFRDEDKAREWLESLSRPDGPTCPYSGITNVQTDIKHKTMTHRCRECPKKPIFTARIGTIMEHIHLKYRVSAIGMYLCATDLKGFSSMKLHRLRKAAETGASVFSGPVEVDETSVSGREKNKHNSKKTKAECGPVGKAVLVGVKDRG